MLSGTGPTHTFLYRKKCGVRCARRHTVAILISMLSADLPASSSDTVQITVRPPVETTVFQFVPIILLRAARDILGKVEMTASEVQGAETLSYSLTLPSLPDAEIHTLIDGLRQRNFIVLDMPEGPQIANGATSETSVASDDVTRVEGK